MFVYNNFIKQNNVRKKLYTGGINMKIKNKKKFRRAIFIVVFFTILGIILLSNQTLSHGEVKTKTIYISGGETLWGIAQMELENNNFFENKSIREVIYNIKSINNLENSYIYEGQKLIIPYI